MGALDGHSLCSDWQEIHGSLEYMCCSSVKKISWQLSQQSSQKIRENTDAWGVQLHYVLEQNVKNAYVWNVQIPVLNITVTERKGAQNCDVTGVKTTKRLHKKRPYCYKMSIVRKRSWSQNIYCNTLVMNRRKRNLFSCYVSRMHRWAQPNLT